MEKNLFLDCVSKQLQNMSAAQKDAWILAKAKLLSESEQQDFMMSLTGEKIISYMPAETEIRAFCEKVINGDIFMEYEMHYEEFNSEGRYVDDWIVQYNDPKRAFSFLNRTFSGCHDLIQLEEYDLAGSILDQICRLEFQVVEAEDSEGFEDDSPFAIADAGNEQLLSMNTRDIAYDWVLSLLMGKENHENAEFARKLTGIFKMELCKGIQLSDFCGYVSEKLLDLIEEILEEENSEICMQLEKIADPHRYWRKKFMLEKKMTRNQHLLLDIRKKCRKQDGREEKPDQASVLQASWEQICELFKILNYKPFIDDGLEIDEVWNICGALLKRGGLEKEDWGIRKKILSDMVGNGFYGRYGCSEPVKKLAEKLTVTDAEILEYADMLNEHGYYAKEAAGLYRQYGRMDLYIRYLETHLDRSSEEYLALIQCYSKDGNQDRARETAELGLQKCKDDLTGLFIFLLQDAKMCKDEARYKKLYASAKRRKKADIVRINEAVAAF